VQLYTSRGCNSTLRLSYRRVRPGQSRTAECRQLAISVSSLPTVPPQLKKCGPSCLTRDGTTPSGDPHRLGLAKRRRRLLRRRQSYPLFPILVLIFVQSCFALVALLPVDTPDCTACRTHSNMAKIFDHAEGQLPPTDAARTAVANISSQSRSITPQKAAG
jgi:hypothetical protein